jgi:hypothetical protein
LLKHETFEHAQTAQNLVVYLGFIKSRNTLGINLQVIVSLKVFCTKKDKPRENEEKHYCSVCGAETSEEDYEDYDGMCWECWDDQLTEEYLDMFGDFM